MTVRTRRIGSTNQLSRRIAVSRMDANAALLNTVWNQETLATQSIRYSPERIGWPIIHKRFGEDWHQSYFLDLVFGRMENIFTLRGSITDPTGRKRSTGNGIAVYVCRGKVVAERIFCNRPQASPRKKGAIALQKTRRTAISYPRAARFPVVPMTFWLRIILLTMRAAGCGERQDIQRFD